MRIALDAREREFHMRLAAHVTLRIAASGTYLPAEFL